MLTLCSKVFVPFLVKPLFGEDTPDHIFIDIDPECLVDLLRDPWTSVPWISALHFNDGMDEFYGWTLWTRFAFFTR